ncbi:phage tail sheath protein [Acinetobacter guillouiae]|uniref:hypothetical protein n=1 Tax=Acinetobacter guillouiae TaxID=106649 RepID=UPI000BBC6FF4|nr:hypothetical protein [Acinetobacter guillouiae]
MAEFHHGISKREPTSGIIPMRDADTNVIGLIAFSDDADENVFPLDTPTLVTSINRALAASGTEGNLRACLETMSAITSPTLVVIRIQDPFKGEVFNQSLVIGTTLPTGQRTGIQALLTAKSILGITPKINIAPDVETPDVVQALASVNKKIRAFSYVTPRDIFGVMLETMQDVTAYRDTLSDREIMLIWPEFTSGNVFLGRSQGQCDPSYFAVENVAMDLPISAQYTITYDLQIPDEDIDFKNKVLVMDNETNGTRAEFETIIHRILNLVSNRQLLTGGGGGVAYFQSFNGWIMGGDGSAFKGAATLTLKKSLNAEYDFFDFLRRQDSATPLVSPLEIHSCGVQNFLGL